MRSSRRKYAGRSDVPIFSDPRIVPTFHGVGPGIFANDPKSGELREAGKRFAARLDAHPGCPCAMMRNGHPGQPIVSALERSDAGPEQWSNILGESQLDT